MAAAASQHTIPGQFYDVAAATMGGECNDQGNVWQRLSAAGNDERDDLTLQLLERFIPYAKDKSYPRSAAHNSGHDDAAQRATRQHHVPKHQTFLQGSRDDNHKQHVSNSPSASDVEGKLLTYDQHDHEELLRIDAEQSRDRGCTPFCELLSPRPDRFYTSGRRRAAQPVREQP